MLLRSLTACKSAARPRITAGPEPGGAPGLGGCICGLGGRFRYGSMGHELPAAVLGSIHPYEPNGILGLTSTQERRLQLRDDVTRCDDDGAAWFDLLRVEFLLTNRPRATRSIHDFLVSTWLGFPPALHASPWVNAKSSAMA